MPNQEQLVVATSSPYADGHVLLRRGGHKKSDLIGTVTGGEYSHAGICGDAGRGMAVDAYPGRDPYSVASLPLDVFFGASHAPGGGSVFRYAHDEGEGAAAAQYAQDQTRLPYTFDIQDPIVGADGEVSDNNAVYCSEFVWRCYRFGANVRLVDPDDFYNLSEPENLTRAGRALLPEHLAQQYGQWARMFGVVIRDVPKVEGLATEKVRCLLVSRGHNGLFITPQQLAETDRLAYVGERA